MDGERLRTVFLGSGVLGLELLHGLHSCPAVQLAGVLPWSAGPGRRSTDTAERALVSESRRRGLLWRDCPGANSPAFARRLAEHEIGCVLVGAWGEILRPAVLATPGVHFVNCHPSLLPAHRGPNPYSSVLRSGEPQTGVSFHLIVPAVDRGALISQSVVSIEASDTGVELRARCAARAREQVCAVMRQLALSGAVDAVSQDTLGAGSYHRQLVAADARVQWRLEARRIRDHVRGVQPWLVPCTAADTAIGRVSLRFSRVRLKDVAESAAAPGTVAGFEEGALWVHCGSPAHLVGLAAPRLNVAGVDLGGSLSRLLMPALLGAGSRLIS